MTDGQMRIECAFGTIDRSTGNRTSTPGGWWVPYANMPKAPG